MILLDLDGVLADFNSAASFAHGRIHKEPTRWDYFEGWGIDLDEFWRPIHELRTRFYEDIVEPYSWCDELLDEVRKADDFVIVSAPSKSPYCYAGKRLWVDKYVGTETKLIVASEKHLLSKPGHLLIDDNDTNVWKFTDQQIHGDAIYFPQPWNEGAVFINNRMGYIREELADWSVELV